MSMANVVVQKSFTTAIRQPNIPAKLSLHQDAVDLFRQAPEGVSFTGCVHVPTAVVYLAPLVAVEARGNVEIESVRTELHSESAGLLTARTQKPEHLFHPNLSPQGRALIGETSGHTKVCLKYGLDEDACVGFAVTKSADGSKLTTNSRTLNTEKFRVEHEEVANQPNPKLKALMLRNLGTDSKPSQGALSKEWAYKIAATIEIALAVRLHTQGGNFEAPF